MELTALMIIIGMLLPALIGTVTKESTSKKARFWISFGFCALFGFGVNFLERNGVYTGTMIDIANSIATSIIAMTGIVKLSYEGIWDNQAVGKALPDTIVKGNQTPLDALGLTNPK